MHLCTNNFHDMIDSSWDIECDRLKLVICVIFCPFNLPSKTPKNQNFEKMKKNRWRYHHFTPVYQKSYDVQFLRYRVRKAKKFVILGHFLPFYPPNNQENQNKKKMKKKNEKSICEMSSFYTCVPKITIIWQGCI